MVHITKAFIRLRTCVPKIQISVLSVKVGFSIYAYGIVLRVIVCTRWKYIGFDCILDASEIRANMSLHKWSKLQSCEKNGFSIFSTK